MLLLTELGLDGLRKRLDEQNGGLSEELAAKLRAGDSLRRKPAFEARLRVEEQQHVELLRAHVARFFTEPSIRAEVLQHVDTTRNLQRQVTDAICIAYNIAPRRSLRGLPEDQARVLLDAYRELRVDTRAEKWNRLAFAVNVVHVVPRLVNSEIELMQVLPHNADVIFDEGESKPSILVWRCRSRGGVEMVAVDAERYWWLTKDFKLVEEEEHRMGMRPWVTWRFEDAPESDYWNTGAGQLLFDATMKAARISAHFSWVRLGNAKKLTHIHLGANVTAPENQNLQGNAVVETNGDGAAKIDVIDTIVPPDGFLAELAELTETTLEAYGLPSSVVDKSARGMDSINASTQASVRQHDALAKIRAKQIKQFDHSETELARRLAVLLGQLGKLTVSPDDVRAAFRVHFAPLTFADHPRTKVQTAREQIELGQTNVYEVYQADHPGTTEDEAREAVHHNIEVHAEHVRLLVARGVALDPAKVAHPGLLDPKDATKTPAQVYGMIGGKESGVARAGESVDSLDGVTQ